MHLIEFLGLPGSGKTTLVREVAQRLRSSGRTVWTRQEALADDRSAWFRHLARARYVLPSALRTPRTFVTALRLIRQDGQPSMRAFAKVCWNMWCVLGWYGWLARNPGCLAIVDQGIIQAIWSVRLSAVRDDADWVGFLREIPLIDGIVIVQCSPEVLRARLAVRAGNISRLSRTPADDQRWAVAQRAYRQACQEAQTRAPVLFVVNSESDDLEAGATSILSWLDDSSMSKARE